MKDNLFSRAEDDLDQGEGIDQAGAGRAVAQHVGDSERIIPRREEASERHRHPDPSAGKSCDDHTAAMLWRAKGVDIATIALLLGHESTQTTHIYEHADPALKENAIARTAPLGIKPGRYRPSDTLLAFLEGL